MDTTALKQIISSNVTKLKAFKEGEEALAQLENLEQVTKETQLRVDELKAQEATLQETVDDAKAQVNQAKTDAAKVIDDANVTAAKLVDDAIMEVERYKADNQLSIDQTKEALESFQKQLTDTYAELETAKAELERVNGEIDKVKQAVQSAFPSNS